MLERMRSNLTTRLAILIGRFDQIDSRAQKWQDDFSFGVEAGMGPNDSLPTVCEISTKANEQADLCSQAMDELLERRAFPLIFRNAVKRAERFADQCEFILQQLDDGAEAGRKAFRNLIDEDKADSPRMESRISVERLDELAGLAMRLSKAEADMKVQMKQEQKTSRNL